MMAYYEVAGFAFAVMLDGCHDLDVLLPSFVQFKSERKSELLFELVEETEEGVCSYTEFLEEDTNDLGHSRLYRKGGGYRITLKYLEKVHVMDTDSKFSRISVSLDWDDVYVATALSSMLRIAFAQAILMHSAVSVHSSVVVHNGRAFMFMGSSGTGKSTHSRLWIENIPDTRLLNDDNPIVRMEQGQAVVYGSPWSGKTPCYINESAPVAAMVRLAQAPENRFERKQDIEAFSLLLPGCSVLRYDRSLYGMLCETLIELAEIVCVGEMRCLPDKDAAYVCLNGVKNENEKKRIRR